jgi:hypothetical protein
VGTFASITLYAIFVLLGMVVAAGAFTLLGVLISDSTVEEDDGH